MNKNLLTLPVLFGVILLAGCNTEREKNADRAILKAKQQVSADMVGWVAVPNTAPQTKKEGNIAYSVLATHNVVPETLDGCVAINPAFFSKLSGVKVDVPAPVAGEKWVLKPEGKSVPKDKHGWVAVPYSEPVIEKSDHKKDREMAALSTNNIVPKEMNGWIAVDRDTLAKMVATYMNSGPGSKVSKGE
ncbi:MAG TPA: hypothetical protein VEK08_24850 [Planctomycetota bacterium]|nr:hypothetical protein [Planctomycetota bacterium]